MRRWIVLGVLVTIGALSLVVTANQQQGDMVVEVEQLEDNLFVLRGAGGNTAVFVTSDGVAVVDTMMAGWGRPILDAIKKLTTKPVTMIINTHTHFDHVSGNVEFPATVEVVAHENTQRLMHEWNLITGFNFAGEDVFAASDGKTSCESTPSSWAASSPPSGRARRPPGRSMTSPTRGRSRHDLSATAHSPWSG